MKRFTPVAAVCALALSFATITHAGDNNSNLMGQALSSNTIQACVAAAREPGYVIQSSTTTVSVCFVSGEIKRVDFYREIRCIPNQPCPDAPIRLVASAEFGCNGELISAVCY